MLKFCSIYHNYVYNKILETDWVPVSYICTRHACVNWAVRVIVLLPIGQVGVIQFGL